MNVETLPRRAAALLTKMDAPPRLVAHLSLVHDVARKLTRQLDATWPALDYDRETVWLGAALHDIGKALHPAELSRPGHAHEAAGEALLRAQGYSPGITRICRTHALWDNGAAEDMLVAAADQWWRGRRNTVLEDQICGWIASQTKTERWEVTATLDDFASAITAQADERLAWQGQFATQ